MKRYVAEEGSALVRDAMQGANGWFMCRVGYVETVRAVGLADGRASVRRFTDEWSSFGVVEVDQHLCERAGNLALAHDLRSLDALHLAAALLLPAHDLLVASWDRRLHAAAQANGRRVLPNALHPP